MRWAVLDKLIEVATSDEADIRAARDEWGALSGRVHTEHELYGERSDAFVEWYLLERPDSGGRTRVARLLTEGAKGGQDQRGLSPEERPMVEALSRSYRSLFQVHRIRVGGILIDDLLGGGRFDVDERRRLPGVTVGDLFEGRILPDPEAPYKVLFSRTFLFHPREAQKAVVAHAETARRSGEPRSTVLFRLQRLRLRCTAYKHVPAQRIYAQKDAPP